MKKLLSCQVGDIIYLDGKHYTVTQKNECFINDMKAFRISLFSELESILIEIKREFALNYQIFRYSLVESIKYNPVFLSILGTNTLGYNNPKLSKSNIYKKVKIKKERYDLFKHIVEKDELPKDYKNKGYYKDENGNYYFFTKRYSPQLKKFSDGNRLSWEYKQDNNLRLMIETKDSKNSNIFIYKGREILSSEITVINHDKVSKTPLQPQMSQIPDNPRFSLIFQH
jgi:hypothetical protein